MYKRENKYFVPADFLPELRRHLLPYIMLDEYIVPRGLIGYRVNSLYYDTLDLLYYHEKLAGIKFRKKIRIRGYNEGSPDDIVFFEIKRKNGAFVKKHRVPLAYKHAGEFLRTGDTDQFFKDDPYSGPYNTDAKRFLYHIHRYSLQPTVMIHYDREAFFYKFNRDLRITIDKDVRVCKEPVLSKLYIENGSQSVIKDRVILEIKTTMPYPRWLKRLIAHFELRLEAISKYVMCLEKIKEERRSCYKICKTFS
jgi:SPX domain protein involved in polyphosphate accumulation